MPKYLMISNRGMKEEVWCKTLDDLFDEIRRFTLRHGGYLDLLYLMEI
jgi:hypothetical protein